MSVPLNRRGRHHPLISPALALLVLHPLPAAGQDTLVYHEREVVVTASRVPTAFPTSPRSVVVLKPADLAIIPTSKITEALQYQAGVDLQRRGSYGVQTDLSIRGGSFEQALVLLDGIPLNDPQTGHHTMNLPLDVSQVGRVEILKGPGSRSFGPNAFGGVVNIITEIPESPRLSAEVSGGSYGFAEANVHGGGRTGIATHALGASWGRSDGHRFNTGFESTTLSYRGAIMFGNHRVRGFTGYTHKDFGANSFYSVRFPRQYEKTRTLFASLDADLLAGPLLLTPRISFRRNDDDFVLDYERPSFYHNIHRTNSGTVDLQNTLTSPMGITVLSIGGSADDIASSNLGDHRRTRAGVSLEHAILVPGAMTITAGFFLYRYGGYGWDLSPGIDAGVELGEDVTIFASAARSFRIPTYTELYYSDPVQMGNPDLQPERSLTLEAGVRRTRGNVTLHASVFHQRGEDIIDWVKTSASQTQARAENITRLFTAGFETGFGVRWADPVTVFRLQAIEGGYTYLDVQKDASVTESRYSLMHLRHHAVVALSHVLPGDMVIRWSYRFEDRQTTGTVSLVDGSATVSLGPLSLTLACTNLFDATYEDFAGVPMPGTSIVGHARYTFTDL